MACYVYIGRCAWRELTLGAETDFYATDELSSSTSAEIPLKMEIAQVPNPPMQPL